MDNVCVPGEELFIGDNAYHPTSRHRLTLQAHGETLATRVLLAGGGASGVHANSALVRDDICFVAVGPFVCAVELPALRLVWHTRVDPATCFGLYDAPTYTSLISHGELEIARLSYTGELLWSRGGRDIFSEDFTLHAHHAEATDFAGTRYRCKLETGASQIVFA